MTHPKNRARTAARSARFALWITFTTSALCLSGCQKRCESLTIGPIELGMSERYTPGPAPLLDETIFKYKGPDYPQVAIPVRIESALTRQFPLGSATSPLISALQAQHFACEPIEHGQRCHLSVTVERKERCSLLDAPHHYTFSESVDISIKEEAQRITHITATYDTKNTTNTINQRAQK